MTNLKSNSNNGHFNIADFALLNIQKTVFAFKKHYFLLLTFCFYLSFGQAASTSTISTPPIGLSCIEATIHLTLDDNCATSVPLSMLVTGNTDGIDHVNMLIDGQASNMITACGNYVYSVELLIGDEVVLSCTGNIVAEDNSPPVILCPEDTHQGHLLASVQTISDSLDGTGNTLNLLNYSCFSIESSLSDGEHEYSLVRFYVSHTDVYTLALETEWGDGFMVLFQNNFSANDPCQNIMGIHNDTDNDAGLLDPIHRMALPLQPNQAYTVLVTNAHHDSLGNWNLTFASDGDGIVTGLGISEPIATSLNTDLICNDLDQLRIIGQETYLIQADGNIVPGSMTQSLHDKLSVTGFPTSVADNCSDVLVRVTDELVNNGDCGDMVINRTFQATENTSCMTEANSFSCTQVLTFRKPTLDDVVLPPFAASLECDEGFPTDGEIGGEDDNPAASVTAYPWLLSTFGYVDLADSYCNIGASYSDEPRIDVCTGTYKFRREWNLIDWCNAGDSFTWNQIVKVGNYTGPSVWVNLNNNNGPDNTRIEISTNPFSCTADYSVQYANTVTNCGADASNQNNRLVTIRLANGDFFWAGRERQPNGQPTLVTGIEIGTYTATWCITDECGNETCRTYELIVTDEIAPTAICINPASISLSQGNAATSIGRVHASDINQGSYDNCQVDRILIRRNYFDGGPDMMHYTDDDTCYPSENRWSAWNEYFDFFSCDIDNEITVEMRVYDTNNNFNTCWFRVNPLDIIYLSCEAPEDVSLLCTALPDGLLGLPSSIDFTDPEVRALMNATFGQAAESGNVMVDSIVEIAPEMNLNDCGWGSFTRRFETWLWGAEGDVNNNGLLDREEAVVSINDCRQTISITESHAYEIDFPVDLVINCDEMPDFSLDMEADGCDLLAVNISDPVEIDATGEECMRLIVRYDIINWCLWDGEFEGYSIPRQNPYDATSAAPYDVVVDTINRPVLTGANTQVSLDYTHPVIDRANPYGLLGQGFNVECFAGGFLCRGRWNYTQVLRAYQDPEAMLERGGFADEAESFIQQSPAFELHQNSPNPFSNETSIAFTLPIDNEVHIVVTDMTGRTIYETKGDYVAGYNQVLLTSAMLDGVSGVLNYTLQTESFSATKRMVILGE